MGIFRSGAQWLTASAFGWLTRSAPRSLLDNSPLRTLLNRHLDLQGIERSIQKGALQAICVTASGYESGESISFFQGSAETQAWQRVQRIGMRTRLEIDHLLASSAIPFIFPATRVHREYFGDGSMRQLAPLSPAIHLGAKRLLVIGAGRRSPHRERFQTDKYPTLAQIAGHALSSIFLDSLAVDIERAQRINRTLSALPEDARKHANIELRPIDTLVISPSERLDKMAADYAHTLPGSIRTLLRGIGAMNHRGGALTSYLLFEKPYTRALIDLGYADAMQRSTELGDFLNL